MAIQPDIFTNVHKGIRAALFESCIRLGRATDDAPDLPETLAFAANALRFVAHHGENEDLLLLPMLAESCPRFAGWMADDHRDIEARVAALHAKLGTAPVASLYLEFGAFTAAYLMHMLEEERADSELRDALGEEDIGSVGRRSLERTAPADQLLMLGFMLPAMPPAEAEAMLGKLPPALAGKLAPLAGDRHTARTRFRP
jgi:hypothetical protein